MTSNAFTYFSEKIQNKDECKNSPSLKAFLASIEVLKAWHHYFEGEWKKRLDPKNELISIRRFLTEEIENLVKANAYFSGQLTPEIRQQIQHQLYRETSLSVDQFRQYMMQGVIWADASKIYLRFYLNTLGHQRLDVCFDHYEKAYALYITLLYKIFFNTKNVSAKASERAKVLVGGLRQKIIAGDYFEIDQMALDDLGKQIIV
ncbi:MAG: hypothetical protein A3G32_02920 [Deltaproteobacteria bacterium RIFCSPLOWO2_12_FULL_40_28]|nr:MAG: hypothetical protein A3C45_00300 [Deltaproteobacteria bacterium RIFCSPHIGHO2_02_FULL_40_28]OGQ20067.1 MAG: hypothetical protein A3E27_02965 [Deltaproteobacteria bacterium RIFCSPHIGHO2_12_FULL_40_32]OGQ40634.1 MAG: hypothetical protein A3I69_10390 [Deltaproteobacteria bacterium RIFCSPLOWO2_02_FULL_40_36]OGQ54303.1 MAG: hypothetical protein A3G32_02920 [Deltaproteobacteria bacterium RIFCSPLOWO2_12_FULL_40_28]